MLVAVLSACVSSDGCESWYLCRSVSGDNSVLASGAPERSFVIREAAAQIAHYPRKRVKSQAGKSNGDRFLVTTLASIYI